MSLKTKISVMVMKLTRMMMMMVMKKLDRKKLFNGAGDEAENSRTSLGMDEDSNMSNISTASDSLDGPPTLTALVKPETSSEDGGTKRTTITAEGGIYKGELNKTLNIEFELTMN